GGADYTARLIDEVAAKVVEQCAGALRVTGLEPAGRELRSPPLETGLEPRDRAKGVFFQQFPKGQEVSVPAPVLEHRQHHATLARLPYERAALVSARRKRFVDDHGESGFDRRARERDMGAVRRCDDDEIEIAGSLPDLLRRAQERRVRMVAPGTRPPLIIARDDRSELEPFDRGDQRR